MSEDSAKADKFNVLANDFVKFLEQVTPDSNCPICNHEYWTTLGEAKEMADTYRINLSIKNAERKAVPTFALTCNNCGYVRLHLAYKVKQWVEGHNKQQDLALDDESAVDE